MYKYLEINNMQTHFYFLLITSNVPLQIGKCTPGVHAPQVGNLCYKETINTKTSSPNRAQNFYLVNAFGQKNYLALKLSSPNATNKHKKHCGETALCRKHTRKTETD